MVIEEFYNNKKNVKHYSDKGFLIKQVETGFEFDTAFDTVPCQFTYVETDKTSFEIQLEEIEETEEEK